MINFPPKIHESWYPHLEPLFSHPNMITLKDDVLPNLIALGGGWKYQPAKEDIFNVFSMPLNDIKVVIVGMDPYPGIDQAIGYAFAVNENTRIPKSLQIIFEELRNEFNPKDKGYKVLMPSRDLHQWINQGVFLLNTALTVETAISGSHTPYWKPFIEGVVRIISAKVNPVWILWGTHAKSLIPIIENAEVFLFNNIIIGTHPVVEAYQGGGGFYNRDYFIKANTALTDKGEKEIMWVCPF